MANPPSPEPGHGEQDPGVTTGRRLLGYIRGVRVQFAVSMCLLVGVSLMTAAKALIIQPIVDTFLGSGGTPTQLLVLCGAVLLIFWTQAGLSYGYIIAARKASARVVQRIRRDLFDRLLRQSLGYFGSHPSSDLSTRIVNDVAAFEAAAVSAVQLLLRDLLTIVLLLGVMFVQSWSLALICLAVAIAAGTALRRTSRKIRVAGRAVQDSLSSVARQISEMVGGIEVILSFGLLDRWTDRFESTNREYYEAQVRAERVAAFSVTLVQVIAGAAIGIVLWMTGRALLAGEISEGQFMSLLATLYLLQSPAQGVGSAVGMLSRGMAAGERALEMLDHHPDLTYPSEGVARPSLAGSIEFDRVRFSYERTPTLVDLSFSVPCGSLCVMVGDSGAGKSTVAKLTQRFYDADSGQIRIGGSNLRSLSRENLFATISYVAQDVFVFDAPLRFNLLVGNPGASTQEIDSAIRVACLDEFVSELPKGLDTHVGERGAKLSGGQRQRIAIARAVLADTPILLLDEATSALDMELEQKILQNLVSSNRQRTIFAITHRLTMAEVADQVLVLRQGRLVEQGLATELSARGGEYAKLQAAAGAKLIR